MELRAYWRILRARWWLLLLLPLLAALFSVLTYQPPAISYGYNLRYSVSFLPAPREDMDQDPRLGAVQASEYVADDLTEIFRGSRFAGFVQQYLPEGEPIAISSATRSEKQHRLIALSLTAPSAEQAAQLGQAVKEATARDLDPLLESLWGDEVRLELVDEGGPFPIGGGLRSKLDLPLRVALALFAAVALAFAWDYLDDSVRSRQEAERLVGPVLAEIPAPKGGSRWS